MKVILWNETSGLTRRAKVGFSWTFLFFGLFVPLIRGDLKWFVIVLLLQSISGYLTLGIGSMIVNLIFSFIYNRIYMRELLEKGYQPKEEFIETVSNYVNK